jgi:RHS repeat-associated protein
MSRVVCVVLSSACLVAVSGAGIVGSAQASPGAGGVLSGGSLELSGSQLAGGASVGEVEEVRRSSPEAVVAREESQRKYEGLSASGAAALEQEAFPELADEAAGGPPRLPSGVSVAGYPSDYVAQLELGGGKRGVVDSSTPMAMETSPGQRAPIDLGLVESGGVFRPAAPLVGVQIPARLAGGVQLAESGVSFTPANGEGVALGGSEGSVVGTSVLYANTQTDTDTVVKPTTAGFDLDSVLRSMESPGQLSFRVGLPEGARLAGAGAGEVRVVKEGATLALIAAPSARDAAGTFVPVSMSFSGDVLSVSVDRSLEYQYPILVDPTVIDGQLDEGGPPLDRPSNWREEPAPPSPFHFKEDYGEQRLIDYDEGTAYAREEWGAMAYETQGVSHVYGLVTETAASNAGANIENKLFIRSPGKGMEKEEVLGSSYAKVKKELCVEAACAAGTVKEGAGGNDGNAVEFKQTAENAGSAFNSELANASVEILQEKGPSASINTTSATVGGEPNMFHAGTWVGPRGKAEVTGTDPGLGVYEFRLQSPSKPGWSESSSYPISKCKGVQCSQSVTETGFSAHGGNVGYYYLPNGEDTVEVIASDPVGLSGTVSGKVKVDYSLPYAVALSGLPANKEIGNSEVKVKATAKDGTEAFGGSGIESISLQVDGKEVGTASGSCSPGPCTATSGEWTLNGAEYAAGQHKATVTAKSYAGDVASEEYTFDTGHLAAPVSVGPGSVSPETGEFFLGASDVSVGGPGATLSVRRSYSSMHLLAGAEGPLGAQWAMSVGGAQSLTKAAEGAVVLTDAEGQESVFTSKGKGEFSSPPNAASLKLTEVSEGEKTKEFQLKDGSGQVTKFALPSGGTGNTWVPATLEGPGATNIVTYKFQTVSAITEPTEVLAPVPAGVSCTSELVKGCRALGFVYSSKTTAKGDNASEWGEYQGRLKEVTFTAWNRFSAQMTTTAVAEYVYDVQGKLRGEWNPTISPALETTYGYNAAGQVTAMTQPGKQPWLFDYGTASGDPRSRLVSVTRPSASTAAGDGEAPVKTTAPALSSTHPAEGDALSISTGTWSNSPLSYSYQWVSCVTLSEKRTCTPITGATSQSYVPVKGELGHELYATVTATNGSGSSVAESNTSTGVQAVSFWAKSSEFGSTGEGNGQFKDPWGVAAGESEDIYVADSGNNRVQKFSSTGSFIKAFGKKGAGASEFNAPEGLAIAEFGETQHLYIADSGNNRVESASQSLESDRALTAGKAPVWLAATKTLSGEYPEKLYVVHQTKNEVEPLPMELGYPFHGSEEVFGKEGSGNGQFKGAAGIAIGESAYLYVVDEGGDRVEEFTTSGSYIGQFGGKGSGNGQLLAPKGIAIKSNGFTGRDIYVADSGNKRIEEFNEAGEYVAEFPLSSEPQGIAFGGKKMYVTLGAANKVAIFEKTSAPDPAPEPPTPGTSAVTTIEYHVPVSGAGAPYAMGKTEVEAWGQKDDPSEATAIFPPDEPMGWPAKDYRRASIIYLDSSARVVNTATPGGAIATTEYNAKNDVERALSPDNRAAALKEGSKSAEDSKKLDSESTYNSEGTELQSTLGPEHTVKLASGSEVQARHHVQYSYDEGAPAEGGPYGLPTKTIEGAQYAGKEEDLRETTTSYSGQENLGWKLHEPTSVTGNPKGLKLTHTTVYEPGTGAVKETVMPAGNPKEKTPHATETIYYTTARNATVPACGEHPEWANLPCQTQPAKQPETSGLPNLPITTVTYNVWDEPEQTTETVGTTTRTKTTTFDASGRQKTTAVSSTVGTALPTVTDEYNSETGEPEKQCANEGKPCTEGKPKTITTTTNKLGEMTAYTDADENTATYNYDVDGRIEKTNDGKGTQTYTYDTTTGELTKLQDSAAGTFTASYDTEGNLLTEGYPNGMNATYAYNQAGEPTSLEYKKTTHCTEKCTWFSETVVPSIHGQWLEQTNTQGKQVYTYDNAGRLTQVQDTPAGKGCTTRVYAYDEDTNRTSLNTYQPGAEGKCATEKDTEEKHAYDPADRLTDTGTKYNTFGDITALPAGDAGGSELTSAYYTDNQLESQTQNGETITYDLDPDRRTRETISSGKTSQHLISHYAGDGDTPAWTTETTSGIWTRDIAGINGGLAAVQSNGESPILELASLHGDIIATAGTSETETKLLSTSETTEFGVPTTSAPAKYSWLGADQLPTELPSGEIAMGARSYIPQLGRFLQPDPISGGSADAYAYTYGDPINTADPSGELTYGFSGWLKAANNQEAKEVAEREVARETLEREEAERRAAEAEAAAAAAAAASGEGPPEPLGGSPEWLCQAAAESGQEVEGCGGGGGSVADGRNAKNEDPGLPPGARCEGNVDSKQYRKEHPKLCHEIESNPGEPAEALCAAFWWTNPWLAAGCSAGGSAKYFAEHHR